jgi:hypothetical protein
MSDSDSPLSPGAQQFLAKIANEFKMAKLTGRTSLPINGPATKDATSSAGGWYTFQDPGDKIIQLPIGGEDRVFSLYEEMKAQLANDPVC